MKVLAAIPSRYERDRLAALLECLDDVDVVVFDNGHEPPLSSSAGVGVVYPDWPRPLVAGLPTTIELEPTEGTVTDGGMTGFAFVVRVPLPVPPFDEGFTWWYGDDAFERSVRAAGYRVCRIRGLPCEHESDSEANDWARRPELRDLAAQDGERWRSICGR